MSKISFVTGANGHLGNNLVRQLLKRGEMVRAGIRNMGDKEPFKGLDCEVVYADLLNKDSLIPALKNVDTLYQVGAVFKHKVLDAQKDIILPNNMATKNILEAAKEANVRKIVYVSSVAALSLYKTNAAGKIDETTWLEDSHGDPYLQSKLESEKIAWDLANKLDLDMVSVLPGSLIGGEFLRPTPTIIGFNSLIYGKMKLCYITEMSPIDVNDVANGMILAAEKGIRGKRYILANEEPVKTEDIIQIAKLINPELEVPKQMTKEELLTAAKRLEEEAKKNHTTSPLYQYEVEIFYGGINRNYDLTTSRNDLGFTSIPGKQVVNDYYKSIYNPDNINKSRGNNP